MIESRQESWVKKYCRLKKKRLHEQFDNICRSMGCLLGDHVFSYHRLYIDRSAFNELFNDEPIHKIDETFWMNL